MDRFEHIDLDRTFRRYDAAEQEHDLQTLELHDQLGIDHRWRWRDLESASRVVVLGEARAGKSEELRHQARRLKAAGELAFMTTVEDLHDHGLAHAMTDEGVDGLAQWKRRGGVAHLFIDSIDEARLTGQRLEAALRRITRELSPDALARARIVMSCRYADWRRIQDLQTVGELLGGNAVEVVVLDRLDWKQIETLVRARGPHNPDELLERLRTTGAVALAQRPGDLDWLIAYWDEHQHIASLSAVIEDAIERFLREEPSRQREQTLSSQQARRAVEQLAGIMTIGRWNQLDHPTDGAGVSTIERLVPASVLSDLSPPQLREVLSSRLFDPATLGRTRFRHRTIREYLAARWLDSLCERGLDVDRLEELLFVARENQTVARPSMAPVAAWLAPRREHIVRPLLEASPRSLIVDGDPGNLPDALRIKSLVAHANRFSDRERLSDSFDGVHLQNFACPALAPTVEDLLGRDTPEQLQIMLLRLARHGGLSGCRGAVMRLAMDEERSTYVRGCAIETIGEIGSRDDRQALVARYLSVSHIDGSLLESLIETLYPDDLDGPAVISLIRAFMANRQVPPDSYLWLRFSRTLLRSGEELPRIVEGLRELLDERQATNEAIEPHDNFAYGLYDAALAAMVELWQVGDDLVHLERAIVDVPSAGKAGFRHYGRLEQVGEALKPRLELRRALFERLLDCGDEPNRRSALHRVCGPEAQDGPWLADLAQSSGSTQVREAALLILLQHPRVTELDISALRDLVEDAPDLARHVDERIERRKIASEAASQAKRKHDEEEERVRCYKEQLLQRLRARLDRLRSGEAREDLIEVYARAMQSRSSDLDALETTLLDEFGSEIADAATQGFRAIWRTYDHECDVAESRWFLRRVVWVGLELDVREGLDFRTLSDSMARRATTIALMNREWPPPSWLEGLARAHPNAIRRAIERLPADEELILRLCRTPQTVWHLCVDRLWAVIESPDRYSARALRASLGALLTIDEAHARLRDVCVRECPNEPAPERWGGWWATWFRFDPGRALANLEGLEGDDREHIGELTAWAAASMWTGPDALPRDASILERLWSLFVEWIPAALLEIGSRDPRRVAIDTARGRIIEALGSVETPGGLEALQRLADRFADRRDWLLDRVDRRLAEEADVYPSPVVARIVDGCKRHGLGFVEQAGTILRSSTVTCEPRSNDDRLVHQPRLEPEHEIVSAQPMPEPIRIFISYAHKDETFRQKLEVRLKSIGRVVSIEYWSDPKILAGARFEDDIFKQLETADVVILLISPDFMASDYCFSIEMGKALKKYEETGRGVPVPIVVRPEPTWTHHKIGQHQALPKHATAISKWNDEDDAWESVSEGLLALLRDIESRRP